LIYYQLFIYVFIEERAGISSSIRFRRGFFKASLEFLNLLPTPVTGIMYNRPVPLGSVTSSFAIVIVQPINGADIPVEILKKSGLKWTKIHALNTDVYTAKESVIWKGYTSVFQNSTSMLASGTYLTLLYCKY